MIYLNKSFTCSHSLSGHCWLIETMMNILSFDWCDTLRVKFRLQHSYCISQYTFQYNYFILFPDKFIFHHFLKLLSNCCAYVNVILQLCVRPRMWNAYKLIATKSTFRKMKSRFQLFICLLTIICRNGELMIIKILIIGLPFIKLYTFTYVYDNNDDGNIDGVINIHINNLEKWKMVYITCSNTFLTMFCINSNVLAGCHGDIHVSIVTADTIPVDGGNITLGCSYSPMVIDRVVWQDENGSVLASLNCKPGPCMEKAPKSQKFDLVVNGSTINLTIRNLTAEDSGNYQCSVQTKDGDGFASITVEVHEQGRRSNLIWFGKFGESFEH